VRLNKLNNTPTKKEFEMTEAPKINPIRDSSSNTPVTAEEVAYQLFEFFSRGSPFLRSHQDGLPFFAKCMAAVRNPEEFLNLGKR